MTLRCRTVVIILVSMVEALKNEKKYVPRIVNGGNIYSGGARMAEPFSN